jgi:signal transduction histidine kinase
MRHLRTGGILIALALVGVAGTIVVGVATGLSGEELRHVLVSVAPVALITLAAAWAVTPLLARRSLRWRFVGVAVLAAIAAVANLALATSQMFVSEHDAALVVALLVYATAVGTSAAVLIARRSSDAVAQLERTARRLGAGELDTRIGPLGAGPELDMLADTLDDMAARLEAAQARERELEVMRRDLIITLSHDLRTPLSSLRAMVEAIDDGVVDDPPSLHRYASEIRRSTQQLSQMVDDLFELTQLDAGAIEAETRRASVDEVVSEALATVEREAQEKHLALVTDLGAAGPAQCSPRLARVLQNLLVNAVRHTPADGTVRVEAVVDAGRLALAVEDTGEGIAPEDLGRVFEPFYRVDPARSGGGAGLGLALAKRIVEALGGTISAESGERGARFAVDLPAT